ncbi:TlpA disulfide reductase family protein [Bacteriovorax sp. PP10]|uniref:TlpA disulfide reductase family protein n=1 Tax=Bacteriovorax antarcticus TaxID=3088717 RepID=A0ABU5VX50_9BACT|nr:TlpA disulfide reductase family protein [Bacteriovorax sp. PP10]MEA9357641.1 TlpA disulfide reductase family protein [Bacteriovorax sp. PP10]
MKQLVLLLFFFSLNAYAEKLPDFNLPVYNTDSKFHLSESLKDKKVLINFWATWCTSCIHEIPLLEALKEKYGKDVVFVAVNAGEKSNLIERFLKKYKFSYILLKDEDRSFSKSIGVDSLPVTIVLDKDRNIIYRDVVPPKEI